MPHLSPPGALHVGGRCSRPLLNPVKAHGFVAWLHHDSSAVTFMSEQFGSPTVVLCLPGDNLPYIRPFQPCSKRTSPQPLSLLFRALASNWTPFRVTPERSTLPCYILAPRVGQATAAHDPARRSKISADEALPAQEADVASESKRAGGTHQQLPAASRTRPPHSFFLCFQNITTLSFQNSP